jgi:selenide,water dikinase
MGPAALAQVLRPLNLPSHPNLLIGLATSDDAAVYRIAPDQALVQTVDFFPPVVDDPYTFGAIAAANALSDVYAMGGTPIMALAIAAFPDDLPATILSAILQGGADKVAEAGAVVAGGHTVVDKEPKYGLCVTGTVHPDRILAKGRAAPGDVLLLTKPLGTGAVTTAHKRGVVSAEHLDAAVTSMLRLNRRAAELAAACGARTATDITGFGLLGHASEMARNSGVALRFSLAAVPLLPGALHYAENGVLPGGQGRNRTFLLDEGLAALGAGAEGPRVELLFDPQTSGGLLVALPPAAAAEFKSRCAEAGEPCAEIGVVEAGSGIVVDP